MAKVFVDRLRAHHIANLYFSYIVEGELPRKESHDDVTFVFNYPLLIIDTTDAICIECKPFPAINFCRGPRTRSMDHFAAEKLEVNVGEKYNDKTLAGPFKRKAEEHGFVVGESHNGDFFMEKFYGDDWKKRFI